ncbi:hypothetical protein ABZ896_31410 [Streptomyces sp. NPDC047072]|uniref:hypothetical protein n=1 Tax=Streptomyces sp. NPDC047072 TaxID=3154809 RepID=UPI0033D89D60
MAHRKHSLSHGAALCAAVAATAALLTGCTPNSGGSASAAETPSSSAPSPTPTTPAPGHTTAGSPPKTGGCTSLVVSSAVKANVTTAYGNQARPRLTHLAPVKGTFYYGSCDGTFYAATRFRPTAGSTEAEQVALQDDGSAMKYFVDRPGTGWTYLASDGFPASPQGCAAITRIPSSLASAWDDCHSTA